MLQSDHLDKSIVGSFGDKDEEQSETEEDVVKRVIAENEKLMINPPTIEDMIDQYAQF